MEDYYYPIPHLMTDVDVAKHWLDIEYWFNHHPEGGITVDISQGDIHVPSVVAHLVGHMVRYLEESQLKRIHFRESVYQKADLKMFIEFHREREGKPRL